jgi:aspartate racemase
MATLGLIGGIAPGSTMDYYRLLIERYGQASGGRYPSLVINSIDLKYFLELAAGTDRAPLVEYLVREVERLARAGSDFALFASNTPHLVFDQVAVRSAIPLISIVETAAKAARGLGLASLGLLGTRFTMEGGFYPAVFARSGLRVAVPNERDRAWVHEVYVGELVHGQFREETRRGMREVIGRLRDEAGIDGVILGGTELPLLLRGGEADLPLLDTTRLHVDDAVAALLSREAG